MASEMFGLIKEKASQMAYSCYINGITNPHQYHQAMGELLSTKILSKVTSGGSLKVGGRIYSRSLVNLMRNSAYEKNFKTFLDIGANVGEISMAVMSAFEQCVLIEPSPSHASFLASLAARSGFSKWRVIPVAIGRGPGKAKLFLSESGVDNSIHYRQDLKPGPEVIIETLDSVVRDSGAKPPYLIKIDVQGNEPDVVNGGQKVLASECLVILEFWPWGMTQCGCSAEEMILTLSSLGYDAMTLNKHKLSHKKLLQFCRFGYNNRSVSTDIAFARS